jgi:hypothetical protein
MKNNHKCQSDKSDVIIDYSLLSVLPTASTWITAVVAEHDLAVTTNCFGPQHSRNLMHRLSPHRHLNQIVGIRWVNNNHPHLDHRLFQSLCFQHHCSHRIRDRFCRCVRWRLHSRVRRRLWHRVRLGLNHPLHQGCEFSEVHL